MEIHILGLEDLLREPLLFLVRMEDVLRAGNIAGLEQARDVRKEVRKAGKHRHEASESPGRAQRGTYGRTYFSGSAASLPREYAA